MTRITIKRQDGIDIGAITSNGQTNLYFSLAATRDERADMERAKNNIIDNPAKHMNVVGWLRSKGYGVKVTR